jgi:hypothetical protein
MVGDKHQHADAVTLFEAGGDRPQTILAARGDHQVETVGGEHVGKRLADARGSAGNQCRSRVVQLRFLSCVRAG